MQQTFADAGFERYRKSTRRERFLAEMNQVPPWNIVKESDPLILRDSIHAKRNN